MISADDIFARYQRAERLLHDGQFDEAGAECAWLWQHMLEHAPSMAGVRRSFFLATLAELVQRHLPSRAQFTSFRDALDSRVQHPEVPRRALGDWLSLNKVLQEDDVTLRWFDDVWDLPGWLQVLQAEEQALGPLLLSRGRWRHAGLLVREPLSKLVRALDLLMALPPSAAGGDEEIEARRMLIEKIAAELIGSLVAASRFEEAKVVEAEALRRDGGERMRQAIASARSAAEEGRPVEQAFSVPPR